jgi:hypothetical protein
MWHLWSRGEMHTEFWWGNLRERDHLGPRCRWENNINLTLKEVEWGAWTGLIWLRVGTGGGLSWTRWRNLGGKFCGKWSNPCAVKGSFPVLQSEGSSTWAPCYVWNRSQMSYRLSVTFDILKPYVAAKWPALLASCLSLATASKFWDLAIHYVTTAWFTIFLFIQSNIQSSIIFVVE